ncbi:MAG: TIGR01459 family HAD-type hydrolase [Geminicoccaceae bacterium]|nr:MAG: TIGR01459 family HAD-type hydrolase [Geminicoccaceae bacterium]
MPQPIEGLRPLADTVDAFVLDLWGVVHGGQAPFPGVVETLQALRAAGKPIAFVTNAPVRAHHVAAHLRSMGLGEAYDALVTSGEATYERLSEAYAGGRYLPVGPSWAKLLHDELPLTAAGDVAEADVLLVVGLDEQRPEPEQYDAELQAARARDLPLICANPDRVIVVQDGTYSWCAGALADRYVALGGRVEWMGKPDPAIFARAAGMVGVTDPSRVAVVGDGLPTDIAGANAYGAKSVLITRGIHARDLGIQPGEVAAVGALRDLVGRHGFNPDYALASLAW